MDEANGLTIYHVNLIRLVASLQRENHRSTDQQPAEITVGGGWGGRLQSDFVLGPADCGCVSSSRSSISGRDFYRLFEPSICMGSASTGPESTSKKIAPNSLEPGLYD
jgi:hypothetical protein